MADDTKKNVETKKEESKETNGSVDQLAINNKQASEIAALQADNLKIKDFIGKKAKGKAASNAKKLSSINIAGLQGLKGFKSFKSK